MYIINKYFNIITSYTYKILKFQSVFTKQAKNRNDATHDDMTKLW